MTNSFYSSKELASLGFKSVGSNVLLSRKASIYGASKIEIGNNVRIDDFCILSGKIKLGNNIHISAFVALYGALGIELEDYAGISPKTSVFSAMDDFSGDYLIGPIHPENLTNVTGEKVIMRKFSQIGASCVLFPGVEIGEGAVVGAMSLVNKSLDPWTINIGIPAKQIKMRNRNIADKVSCL